MNSEKENDKDKDKEKEKVNKPAKKVVVKKKSVLKNIESDSENEDDDY